MEATSFSFNCEFCHFHTNSKSNWTAHKKSKMCTNGIKKNYCSKCCKQFQQKSHYTARLKSNVCIEKHRIQKDKPIDIINTLSNEFKRNFGRIDELYDQMNDFEYNHLILFLAIRTPGSHYTLPKHYLDSEAELEDLVNRNEKIYRDLLRWKKIVKRVFTISIGEGDY